MYMMSDFLYIYIARQHFLKKCHLLLALTSDCPNIWNKVALAMQLNSFA